MSNVAEHYDDEYFAWQNRNANLGASLNAAKFRKFLDVQNTRNVVDFGCGGGQLLNELAPPTKVGIEINPVAAAHAKSLGVEVHSSLSELATDSVDLVISNHALEHVDDPFGSLKDMLRVLRPGRLAIVVVPCDSVRYPFVSSDRDFHLYSWSAGNLGNLAVAAGFIVVESAEYRHKWLPKWPVTHRILGRRVFDVAAVIWASLDRRRSQVRLVARKPDTPDA